LIGHSADQTINKIRQIDITTLDALGFIVWAHGWLGAALD
jgi:hypothetical protein